MTQSFLQRGGSFAGLSAGGCGRTMGIAIAKVGESKVGGAPPLNLPLDRGRDCLGKTGAQTPGREPGLDYRGNQCRRWVLPSQRVANQRLVAHPLLISPSIGGETVGVRMGAPTPGREFVNQLPWHSETGRQGGRRSTLPHPDSSIFKGRLGLTWLVRAQGPQDWCDEGEAVVKTHSLSG